MANPVWDGIEIDWGGIAGYGWNATKITVNSIEYPLLQGYMVAGLREMDEKVLGVSQAFAASYSTLMTIGLGSKSIVIETGKGFAVGTRIHVSEASSPQSVWEGGIVDA